LITNRQPGVFIVAASAARREILQKLLCVFMPPGSIHAGAAFSVPLQRSGTEVVLADLASSAEASSMLKFLSTAPSATAHVALIDDPDPHWVRRALAAGVNAIISREAARDDLQLAIDAADTGLVLLHPTSVRGLIAPADFALKSDDYRVEELTAREREVLHLMSAGLGNKEIALRLGISDHTVKFHASSIMGKLGASSRTEAVSQGIRLGLISL